MGRFTMTISNLGPIFRWPAQIRCRLTTALTWTLVLTRMIILDGCAREPKQRDQASPVVLEMPMRKWRETEAVQVKVTLRPPPETECLIPWLDQRVLRFRVFDHRGQLLSQTVRPYGCRLPHFSKNFVAVYRENLSDLAFMVRLNEFDVGVLGPGHYTMSAVYDAREVRQLLEDDPSEPLFVALASTCGIREQSSSDDRRLRDLQRVAAKIEAFLCAERKARLADDPIFSACWETFKALDKRTGCIPKHGKFFEGPHESNVVEFEVIGVEGRRGPKS